MLKLKENRGIKNYLGRTRILMVAMMVIMAVVASLWGLKKAGAFEGDDWTETSGNLTMTIVSLEQNGLELAPLWSEYIYNGSNGSGDFGDYYFSVANNTDKLRVGVLVNGMEEGKVYKIFNNQTLTSESNGQVIYGEERPSAYMEDSTYCEFEGGEEHCWVRPLVNEYMIYVSFYEEHYEESCYKSLIVRPEKVGSQNVEIVSVKQNGEDVFLDTVGRQVTTWEELENTPQTINEFRLDDYNAPVEVTYKLKNLEVGKGYSVSIGNDYRSFTADATEKVETRDLNLNVVNKHISAFVSLHPQDSYDSSEYVYLYFRVADPTFVALGDLIVDEISQGGVAIEPKEKSSEWSREYTFDANDVQPLTIRMHAISATAEMNYYLSYSMYGERGGYQSSDTPMRVTGEELERQGVVVTIPAGYGFEEYSPLTLNLNVSTVESNNYYYGSQKVYYEDFGPNRDNSDYFKINYYEDENIPRYGASLKYANGEEVGDMVNPEYNDEEHPLTVRIDGERYDSEQTYDIHAKVLGLNEESLYDGSFTVSGAQLNAGYEIVLEGLVVAPPVFDPNEGLSGYDECYKFSLEIDGLEQSGYLYSMYDGWINTLITYEGGEVVAMGNGGGMGVGPYITGSGVTMRKTSLDGSKGAVLHYLGGGFDDGLTYNYAVYYNDSSAVNSVWTAECGTKVYDGVLTGAELNNEGLAIDMVVPNDESEGVVYTLAITRNNGLVIMSRDYMMFTNDPKIESFRFSADSDSFMQTNWASYRVAKNTDVMATLTGDGFTNDAEYRLWVNYEGYRNGEEQDEWGYSRPEPVDITSLNESVVVTGAELNAGYVYNLDYDDVLDGVNFVEVDFVVTDEDVEEPNWHGEMENGHYAGHSIYIDYVNDDEVFRDNGYQVNEDGTITDVSQPDDPHHGPDEPEEVPVDIRTPGEVDVIVDGTGLTIVSRKPTLVIGLKDGHYSLVEETQSIDNDGERTNSYDMSGYEEIKVVLKGDGDMDGEISSADSNLINRSLISSSLRPYRELSELERIVFDLDGDNEITSSDSNLINRSLISQSLRPYKAIEW